MKDQLEAIQKEALEKVTQAANLKELQDIRVSYLGKKDPLQKC